MQSKLPHVSARFAFFCVSKVALIVWLMCVIYYLVQLMQFFLAMRVELGFIRGPFGQIRYQRFIKLVLIKKKLDPARSGVKNISEPYS